MITQEQADRMKAALEEIIADAPDEEPTYDTWGGDTEKAEMWGLEQSSWEAAEKARRGLGLGRNEEESE